MNGAVPPLSHTLSRIGENQLYAYLYSSDCDILNNGLEETCHLHFNRLFWELLERLKEVTKACQYVQPVLQLVQNRTLLTFRNTNHGTLQTQPAQGL